MTPTSSEFDSQFTGSEVFGLESDSRKPTIEGSFPFEVQVFLLESYANRGINEFTHYEHYLEKITSLLYFSVDLFLPTPIFMTRVLMKMRVTVIQNASGVGLN